MKLLEYGFPMSKVDSRTKRIKIEYALQYLYNRGIYVYIIDEEKQNKRIYKYHCFSDIYKQDIYFSQQFNFCSSRRKAIVEGITCALSKFQDYKNDKVITGINIYDYHVSESTARLLKKIKYPQDEFYAYNHVGLLVPLEDVNEKYKPLCASAPTLYKAIDYIFNSTGSGIVVVPKVIETVSEKNIFYMWSASSYNFKFNFKKYPTYQRELNPFDAMELALNAVCKSLLGISFNVKNDTVNRLKSIFKIPKKP